METNYQQKAHEFFTTHEAFMVRLCEILRLDYLEATEQDILAEVQFLQNMWDYDD